MHSDKHQFRVSRVIMNIQYVAMDMKTAILFLFYKNFDLCRKNIKRTRRLNPELPIYAFYTGSPEGALEAGDAISDLVDDYYAFPEQRDAQWRWRHFDVLLTDWYRCRGVELSWDSLFLMQWDMLLAASVGTLYPHLRLGQAMLPSITRLDDIRHWYHFADQRHSDVRGFRDWLSTALKYSGDIYVYPIVVAILPRTFFEKALEQGYPATGYIEYTLPTMLEAYGIEIIQDPRYKVWWNPSKGSAISNLPKGCSISVFAQEIPRSRIYAELASKDGARIFHPVYRPISKVFEKRWVAWGGSRLFALYENSWLYHVPWRRLLHEVFHFGRRQHSGDP